MFTTSWITRSGACLRRSRQKTTPFATRRPIIGDDRVVTAAVDLRHCRADFRVQRLSLSIKLVEPRIGASFVTQILQEMLEASLQRRRKSDEFRAIQLRL